MLVNGVFIQVGEIGLIDRRVAGSAVEGEIEESRFTCFR